MTALQPRDQAHVFSMRANPEPNDAVAVLHAERAPANRHASGKDRRISLGGFESETGVIRVALEVPICLNRLPLNVSRQAVKALSESLGRVRYQSLSGSSGRVRPARNSFKASSAMFARVSLLASSVSSQFSSASMSARRLAATASCRSGGSCFAFSTAISRSVIGITGGRRFSFDASCAPIVTLYPRKGRSVSASAFLLLRVEFGLRYSNHSPNEFRHSLQGRRVGQVGGRSHRIYPPRLFFFRFWPCLSFGHRTTATIARAGLSCSGACS